MISKGEWHATCQQSASMRRDLARGRNGLKRVWTYTALGGALLLAMIVPAPHPAGMQPKLFSVVGGDYISPVIFSPRGVQALNARMNSRAHFAGYDQIQTVVSAGSTRGIADLTRYSGDLLSMLSTEFLLREKPGKEDHPAYISEAFWNRVLGQTPDVLGRRIEACGETFQIAGVVRTEADLLGETEVWVPLSSRGAYGGMTSLKILGELQPGANWRSGEKELAALICTERVKDQVVELDAVRLVPIDRKMVVYARGVKTGSKPS